MKYRSKIVSKLTAFKSFLGSCQTTLNIFMFLSASSVVKWQNYTRRKVKGTILSTLNFAT